MKLPGFSAEASLCRVTTCYVLARDHDINDGKVAPQGWGWSDIPTYPGQRCIMRKVRRYGCVTDLSSGMVLECGWYLEPKCQYQIIPLPLPFVPGGPDLPGQ